LTSSNVQILTAAKHMRDCMLDAILHELFSNTDCSASATCLLKNMQGD